MKKLNFKLLLMFGLIINVMSCKAQQILPLNTFMDNIPPNAYVKDLNNELSPYIGTYKANFQGKEITLFITKVENKFMDYGNQKFYQDALVIKYIVKNSGGLILQDTQSFNNPDIQLYSTRIRSYDNSLIFYYSGTNCGVGWGSILLKKINANQFTWDYRPDDITILPGKCPGNPDLTIYLPETKGLIFTKQ